MCDCYWDNPPKFYECRTVRGRKEYKCSECMRVIEKGEKHEYAKGLWEGDFSQFRTCKTCSDMRDEINLTCYCHGHMFDELDERDYPGVQSVAEFLERRRQNWDRLHGKNRQLENA
jgi:hypothetical protein